MVVVNGSEWVCGCVAQVDLARERFGEDVF